MKQWVEITLNIVARWKFRLVKVWHGHFWWQVQCFVCAGGAGMQVAWQAQGILKLRTFGAGERCQQPVFEDELRLRICLAELRDVFALMMLVLESSLFWRKSRTKCSFGDLT